MVGLGRVELPTNGLGNRCSIHLSYRPYGCNLMILYYQSQTEIGGDNPVTNTYLKLGVGLMRQLSGRI
jgi:hypothetical protein